VLTPASQAWFKQGRPNPTSIGFEQGEVRATPRTLQAVNAVIRVHDQHHLVDVRRKTVVIFIPHHNDRVITFSPGFGALDCRHQPLHRDVAFKDQCGVQAALGPVTYRIEIAEGAGVAASILFQLVKLGSSSPFKKGFSHCGKGWVFGWLDPAAL
jgi:hypothetical protein